MDAYAELVAKRKECSRCGSGVINPSATKYDSAQIGPWSCWLGARPAKIMIVGPIWGSNSTFNLQMGKDSAQSDTNRKLKVLLESIGIEVPHAGGKGFFGENVFLTNAILCLKGETKTFAASEKKCYENCGNFLRDTIEIVAPRYIIPLGRRAFNAVINAYPDIYRNGRTLPKWDDVRMSGPIFMGDRKIFAVYCPSPWDWKYQSDVDQKEDWLRIGRFIERDEFATLSNAYQKLKQRRELEARFSPSRQSP